MISLGEQQYVFFDLVVKGTPKFSKKKTSAQILLAGGTPLQAWEKSNEILLDEVGHELDPATGKVITINLESWRSRHTQILVQILVLSC